MVTGSETKQKTKENMLADRTRHKIKRKYEKKFFWTALKLCVYQIKYNIFNKIAHLFFSRGKQKQTVFLRFANRAVNKNICKCHKFINVCALPGHIHKFAPNPCVYRIGLCFYLIKIFATAN